MTRGLLTSAVMTDPTESATKRILPKGEVLFEEGDRSTEMYIIGFGAVEVYRKIGQDHITLATLRRGDFLGEMALLEGLPRSASARAVQDTSLEVIDSRAFTELIRQSPELPIRMIRKYAFRLRRMNARVEQLLERRDRYQRIRIDSEVVRYDESSGEGVPWGKLTCKTTGHQFELRGEENTIGRADPATGIRPNVDLTPVDVHHTVSRRHARFFRHEGRTLLVEEAAVANGTYVNQARVEPGTGRPVKTSDVVQFGDVELRFEQV